MKKYVVAIKVIRSKRVTQVNTIPTTTGSTCVSVDMLSGMAVGALTDVMIGFVTALVIDVLALEFVMPGPLEDFRC